METGDYIYIQGLTTPKTKFIGFDLDGTLINYKDGLDPRRYPTNPDNWQFLGEGILEKIKELEESYMIFIITNQFNISEAKLKMIEQVHLKLERIPFVLIANKRNVYRKPSAGFTDLIEQMLRPLNIQLNRSESYYSGDTIGASDPYPPYQRESGDDLKFAINSGIKFVRPSDILPKFNFNPIMKYQLIIMMGNPGSGKTTYAKYLEQHSYIRFSQDEVGSLEKKLNQIKAHLQNGKCVVLDATFPSSKKRSLWINLISGLKVAIIWAIRDGRPFNALRQNPVSHFAYSGKYGYTANFEEPDSSCDVIKLW